MIKKKFLKIYVISDKMRYRELYIKKQKRFYTRGTLSSVKIFRFAKQNAALFVDLL